VGGTPSHAKRRTSFCLHQPLRAAPPGRIGQDYYATHCGVSKGSATSMAATARRGTCATACRFLERAASPAMDHYLPRSEFRYEDCLRSEVQQQMVDAKQKDRSSPLALAMATALAVDQPPITATRRSRQLGESTKEAASAQRFSFRLCHTAPKYPASSLIQSGRADPRCLEATSPVNLGFSPWSMVFFIAQTSEARQCAAFYSIESLTSFCLK
jgi:hypothetical protein